MRLSTSADFALAMFIYKYTLSILAVSVFALGLSTTSLHLQGFCKYVRGAGQKVDRVRNLRMGVNEF